MPTTKVTADGTTLFVDHRRRTRKPAQRHEQNGADSCTCGALWPCESAGRSPKVPMVAAHLRDHRLVDALKDEIDDLDTIKNPKRRLAAAKELIEYLQLHFVEPGER